MLETAAGRLNPHRSSCAALVHPVGQEGLPAGCPGTVVAAGLLFVDTRPTAVYWAFTCDRHADWVVAARPLWERDHMEITRRRTAGAAGDTVSAMLATGTVARQMVEEARRWAQRNPHRLYRPDAAPQK